MSLEDDIRTVAREESRRTNDRYDALELRVCRVESKAIVENASGPLTGEVLKSALHAECESFTPWQKTSTGVKEAYTRAADKLNARACPSLRDYFAAHALTGVIRDVRAQMTSRGEWIGLEEPDSDNAALIASQCYIVADAMLSARSAAPGGST